ncbi:MAG: hypothetical protein QOH46_130 [Solirubrobacteraceae bacterium]|nr:hypothetical protein [Solirubrobacteraceae bacterium]MEA2245601.1 hypothetical protein [Solirubrobacteraceae bacterium]
MATATKDDPRGQGGSTAAMRFAVDENNAGRFHWRLVAGDGRELATSDESFASAADAQRAADDVRAALVAGALG